jgi:hypothetical protein
MLRYVGAALIWAFSACGAFAQECSEVDILWVTTPTPPSRLAWDAHQRNMAALRTSTNLVLLGDDFAYSWDTRTWDARTSVPTDVQKLGAPSEATQHILFRLKDPAFAKLKAKRLLLMVGSNNFIGGSKPCAIAAGIAAVVDRVREIWPTIDISVLEITPQGDGFKLRDEERRATNALIRKIPDVKTLNVDDQITCQWTEPCRNYTPDKIHFTPDGYRVVFNTLRQGWQQLADVGQEQIAK